MVCVAGLQVEICLAKGCKTTDW